MLAGTGADEVIEWAIHNEIARTRPDLLEVLYQPFPWSWQGQEPPGSKPWYL